jgi:hypothetical protein
LVPIEIETKTPRVEPLEVVRLQRVLERD